MSTHEWEDDIVRNTSKVQQCGGLGLDGDLQGLAKRHRPQTGTSGGDYAFYAYVKVGDVKDERNGMELPAVIQGPYEKPPWAKPFSSPSDDESGRFFVICTVDHQLSSVVSAGVDFSIQFKAFPMKNQPRTFEERRAAVSTIHEPMLIRAVDSSPLPARNDLPMFLAFKDDRAFCALVMSLETMRDNCSISHSSSLDAISRLPRDNLDALVAEKAAQTPPERLLAVYTRHLMHHLQGTIEASPNKGK